MFEAAPHQRERGGAADEEVLNVDADESVTVRERGMDGGVRWRCRTRGG